MKVRQNAPRAVGSSSSADCSRLVSAAPWASSAPRMSESVVAAQPAAAADVARIETITAVNLCQPALPAFDGAFRKRPRAIANLVEVFSLHPEWFSDRELLGEMLTFCYNEDHRPEALAGKHDDLVMAAAICYAARHQQRMTAAGAPVSLEEAVRQKERRRRIRRGRI